MKVKLDQFYTSPKVANKFLKKINCFCHIDKNMIFLEPSAGDGKFIDQIQKEFPNNQIEAFDIEKNHPIVQQLDFTKIVKQKNEKIIVVGNPPFGKRAKLAISFVNKSSEFSNIICFVLPIQFRRWNVQKQLNQNLKLIYSSNNLPENSFLVNNKPYNVNCCYQIWVNKQDKRFKKFRDLRIKSAPASTHPDFKLWIHNNTKSTLKYFNKEKYKWDYAIHRQGYYDYSQKITDPKKLIKNHQYLFVKFNKVQARKIFDKIDFVKLSNSNTTIKGFSNTDVIREYIRLKKKNKINKK